MINAKNKQGLHLVIALGLCLLLTTIGVACGEPSPLQVPPSSPTTEQSPSANVPASQSLPFIADFSADRAEVTEGCLVTLLWTVVGATKVSIDQSVGDVALGGGVAVRPHTTTTYTLIATNAAGTAIKSLVINVKELPSSLLTPPVCSPASPPSCPSCQ